MANQFNRINHTEITYTEIRQRNKCKETIKTHIALYQTHYTEVDNNNNIFHQCFIYLIEGVSF